MREVIMFSLESSPVVFLENNGNSSETDQQEQIWAADPNLNIFKIYRKITVEGNVLNLTKRRRPVLIGSITVIVFIGGGGGEGSHLNEVNGSLAIASACNFKQKKLCQQVLL